MMTATISFSDIVKMIHPDHNPDIQDAGGKMADVKMFRKDEGMLYKLAVKWGLVEAPAGFNTTETPSPSADARFRERKLREYREHLDRLKRQQESRNHREEAQKRQKNEYYHFRVRNRIFQDGDIVYVRTKRATVKITKVTRTRVYFYWEGRTSYAAKKNVRFTRG